MTDRSKRLTRVGHRKFAFVDVVPWFAFNTETLNSWPARMVWAQGCGVREDIECFPRLTAGSRPHQLLPLTPAPLWCASRTRFCSSAVCWCMPHSRKPGDDIPLCTEIKTCDPLGPSFRILLSNYALGGGFGCSVAGLWTCCGHWTSCQSH